MRIRIALSLALLALPALAGDESPEKLFHEAWYKETELKDLDGAIQLYRQVAARGKTAGETGARAQYQVGVCLEKQGKAEEAKAEFRKVADGFPEQKEWVEKALQRCGADAPGESEENAKLARTMRTAKISLNFTEAPLPDVVTFLREYTKVNMLIDASVKDPGEKKITFRVDDIPFDAAFNLILKMLDLEWYADDGVIVITTKEGLKGRQPGIAVRREGKKDPAPEEEDPDVKAIEKTLDQSKVDVEFTDASMEDVVAWVREYSKINIEIDAKVRDLPDIDRKVTFTLKGVPLKAVLRAALSPLGCSWTYEHKVLIITKGDGPPH